MRKRILSLLLCIMMMLSLMPTTAFAGSPVSNLRWDEKIARWDTDGSASQYRIVLTTGSVTLSNEIVDTNCVDYSAYLLPGNSYRFDIFPIVDSVQQSQVVGPTTTIPGSKESIAVSINTTTKTATWSAISGADGYDVWVQKNGSQLGQVRNSLDTSFDFSDDYINNGNGNYSIEVRAYKMHRGNYLAEGKSEAVSLNDLSETITVSFDPNGGSGNMSNVNVAYATTYTLPACSFTPPTGKMFDCWEIDGYRHGEGTSIVFTSDKSIKALWRDAPIVPTEFTVTFYNNGYGEVPAPQKISAGGYATEPPALVKENYVFGGWYTESSCVTKFDFATPITKDTSLFAKWTRVGAYTVTVTTDGNGTAYATPSSGLDGTVVTLTAVPNSGYKFKQWEREAGMLSGGLDVPNATSATTTFTISGYNVGVKAIFEPDDSMPEYTITVNNDGNGTAYASPTSGTDGTEVTLTAVPNSGYKFKQWEREAGMLSGGLGVPNATSATTTFTISGYDVVVKAIFEPDGSITEPTKYAVTFDMGGHGTAPADQTVNEGTKATKPADPTASGYTFDGWYADATFSAAFDFDTAINADTTIYAKWTKETSDPGATDPQPATYTVTFNMNGHGTQVPAQTVEEGNKAAKPADPSASGYTFDGWYADATFSAKFDFSSAINANTTVYAKWTEVKKDEPTKPADPTNPTQPTKPADPTSPKTGDNSHLFLWVALLFISSSALAGTAVYGKKRKYNAK